MSHVNKSSPTEKVEVVAYDEKWPFLFTSEAKRIKEALGDNCINIHHIGSTAVPNLSAKPIIDMIPVVKDILRVKEAIPAMEKLGYESRGEYGMLFRHYFVKKDLNQSFNIHVFAENTPDIERHLKFRDWMRTHSEDREAYQNLKIHLASQFPNDIFSYVTGKGKFVESIDEKTGFDGLRVVFALTNQEWESVTRLRQYIYKPNLIEDAYTWTFKDKNHAHIILYKGTKIIGYVHIELWHDKQRSILRMIVIDERYRQQGFGSHFLKICERWLQNQGVKILHIESTPKAYSFFDYHQYTPMPFNDANVEDADPRNISLGKILILKKETPHE